MAEVHAKPWLKIALFGSLAVNLLVVGVIAGALLGGGPPRERDRPPALAELGMGPFVHALPGRDRAALVRALEREAGAFRENRARMRRHFEALLAALRADPYDPDAVRRLIDDQQARISERQRLGQRLLLERIDGMTEAERAAYADALDRALHRGPPSRRR